jgi:hypothetical protein
VTSTSTSVPMSEKSTDGALSIPRPGEPTMLLIGDDIPEFEISGNPEDMNDLKEELRKQDIVIKEQYDSFLIIRSRNKPHLPTRWKIEEPVFTVVGVID